MLPPQWNLALGLPRWVYVRLPPGSCSLPSCGSMVWISLPLQKHSLDIRFSSRWFPVEEMTEPRCVVSLRTASDLTLGLRASVIPIVRRSILPVRKSNIGTYCEMFYLYRRRRTSFPTQLLLITDAVEVIWLCWALRGEVKALWPLGPIFWHIYFDLDSCFEQQVGLAGLMGPLWLYDSVIL